MALFLAFCSLICTTFMDLLFKISTRKESSRGVFLSLMGLSWTVLLFLFWRTGIAPVAPEHWQATLFWGVAAGLFSFAANLLLVEAMARQNAGVCATIFRLNFVLAALGAALLLGESLTLRQWGGVALAAVTVLALLPPRERRADAAQVQAQRTALLGIGLAVLASVLRAMMGVVSECGIDRSAADPNGIALLTGGVWILGGLLYAAFREHRLHGLARRTALLAVPTGVLAGGNVVAMMGALHCGDAALVLPLAQMSFLPTFVLGVWLLREKPPRRSIPALLCGIAAILLLAL